jgi:hypothetical protein
MSLASKFKSTPPNQIIDAALKDPSLSVEDFRALTLSFGNHPLSCYFLSNGNAKNKAQIWESITGNRVNPLLIGGLVPFLADEYTALENTRHRSENEDVSIAYNAAIQTAVEEEGKRNDIGDNTARVANYRHTVLDRLTKRRAAFIQRAVLEKKGSTLTAARLAKQIDDLKRLMEVEGNSRQMPPPSEKSLEKSLESVEHYAHKQNQLLSIPLAMAAAYFMFSKYKKRHRTKSIQSFISKKLPDPIVPLTGSSHRRGRAAEYDPSSDYARWIENADPKVHACFCKSTTVAPVIKQLLRLSTALKSNVIRSTVMKSKVILRTDGRLRQSMDEVGRAYYYYYSKNLFARVSGIVRRFTKKKKRKAS